MSDIQLTAGIDFTGAEKDAQRLVDNVKKTVVQGATKAGEAAGKAYGEALVKAAEPQVRRLADIMAKANARGGSNYRPGGSGAPGGRSAVEIANSALAAERAYQSALTRTESMLQRIGRQGNNNPEMIDRANRALAAYNSTLREFGTRSMQGVKAKGEFARAMGGLNHELAATNGLLPTLNRGFGSLSAQLGALASGASVVGGNFGAMAGSFATMTSGAARASGALAGLAAGATALVLVPMTVAAIGAAILVAGAATADATDRFNGMIGKLNAATGSMTSANALFAETFNIAQRLGVAVGDVGGAMGRFAALGKDIGLSNAEVSGLVETFLKLGKVSGQTAQEAAASLTQISQSLASGRLQGDEYRSLAENMPALTREIAKAMGVTTGELKKLASEGLVTTDIVLRALSGMAGKINADFETIPTTVSQINARIGNEWDMMLVNLDKRLHLSDLYKFMLKLPLLALEGANKLLSSPSNEDRAKGIQSQITDIDGQLSGNLRDWVRKTLQARRAELAKELDGIQTDMLRTAVEGGQAAIDADNRAWEQRVGAAKRGAKEILEANNPIAKANAEYQKGLEQLNKFKADISPEEYQNALDAITKTRDDAIKRAEKSANTLTIEGKAAFAASEGFYALALELNNAKIATESLRLGEGTLIDVKANEQVTQFLVDYSKRANILGKSLDDLAQSAGFSLQQLFESFRAIEVERAKLNALKRSKDLQTETAETTRLAEATLQGAEAYARVSREIAVEKQLRALGLDSKAKELDSLREEIRLRLEAGEAARSYADSAAYARNLVDETATPQEKAISRLKEIERHYAELKKSGKALSPEIETAFDRARKDATDTASGLKAVFEEMSTSAEEFPDTPEARKKFKAKLEKALA